MPSIQLEPPTLTFHPGFRGAQRLTFTIVKKGRGPVQVEVGPPGEGFSWSTTLAQAGLLTDAAPRLDVEVTFDLPPTAAPVTRLVSVYAADTDGIRLDGSPLKCELLGNVPGVGPGALSIVEIAADPGRDQTNEVVRLMNNSSVELNLSACSLGDFTFPASTQGDADAWDRRTERTLTPAAGRDVLVNRTLRPRSLSGEQLSIWTGAGPGLADRLNAALRLKAPVWNNTRDVVWIKNENGQVIDSFAYVTPRWRGPIPPGVVKIETKARTTVQETVRLVAGHDRWVDTGIQIEDGDLVTFFAAGEIAVGAARGTATPAGRLLEAAEAEWPLPGYPKYGLIGRIGDAGAPFFIGAVNFRFVSGLDTATLPDTLFLGINNPEAAANGGAGYTCAVLVNT